MPDIGDVISWEEHAGVDDPEQRYRLYRLCVCGECGGRGSVLMSDEELAQQPENDRYRCPTCRREGRVRELVATVGTPEALGVALVTLGREGEFEECPLGVLDTRPECEICGGKGRESFRDAYPDQPAGICPACNGSGVKPSGTWIIRPWMPSARNVTDAARTLARSKRSGN